MYSIGLILLFMLCASLVPCEKFSGKYYLTFRGVDKCPYPDDKFADVSTKVRRFNRTHFSYSSNVNLCYGIDDTMLMIYNIAKKGNGGYKDNFYFGQYDRICTTFQELAPESTELIKAYLHIDKICPAPSGEYRVDDFYVPVKYFNEEYPVLPYGEFRSTVLFIKNHENGTQEKLCCLRVYIDSIPQ